MLPLVVRVVILMLGSAIDSRTMGIADDIIPLGFGLLLGAIAVEVALAFGLRGRENTSRQRDEWRKTLKSKE